MEGKEKMRRQIEDENFLRTEEVRIRKERSSLQLPFTS